MANFLPFIYGLASALIWGAGDFSGGVASKRNNTYLVVLISQLVGGFLLAGLALLFKERLHNTQDLLLGAVAGISGMVGLLALYAGLASGQMSVIAPLTAVVSVALPVMVTAVTTGLPPTTTLAGFALASLAVWLLSAGGEQQSRIRWRELRVSIVAGTGFSLFFILIDRVSNGVVFWPLVAARVASVTLLSLFLMVQSRLTTRLKEKTHFPVGYQLGIIALSGILDAGGNTFFALAVQTGRLDIAAVLSSLYPASTILLAWLVLKERLAPVQWIGVLAALVALFLIAI